MYTRDLALSLRALGHEPAIYAPRLGALAKELQNNGLNVSDDIASLPWPHIIHGHHNLPLTVALLNFPGVPAIFICHDAKAWHDEPPRLSAIQHYVAVDFLCRDRLKTQGIPQERISVLGNSVDLHRFLPRAPLPVSPKRALLFNNYATEQTHLRVVREACAKAGLELDARGYGVGNVCENPEAILGNYDIVFAKARCAMEAVACGTAVVLCGAEGAGPLVTSDRFDALRDYNFGRHVLQEPLSADYLLSQILRYNSSDAAKVTQLARSKLGLGQMVQQWLNLYGSPWPLSEGTDDSAEIARFLLRVEAELSRLAQLEPKLAWFEPAYQELRRKTKNAVRLRGPMKVLWKFPPTRAGLRLMGLQSLER